MRQKRAGTLPAHVRVSAKARIVLLQNGYEAETLPTRGKWVSRGFTKWEEGRRSGGYFGGNFGGEKVGSNWALSQLPQCVISGKPLGLN